MDLCAYFSFLSLLVLNLFFLLSGDLLGFLEGFKPILCLDFFIDSGPIVFLGDLFYFGLAQTPRNLDFLDLSFLLAFYFAGIL